MAKVGDLMVSFDPLPGAARVWHAFVDGASWRLTAHQVWEKGGRLIALWGADDGRTLAVHAALGLPEGLFWITLPLSVQSPEYPDLGDLFAPANRMQRAAFDLVGVRARGAEDTRRWLRHTAWPAGEFPLRKSVDAGKAFEPERPAGGRPPRDAAGRGPDEGRWPCDGAGWLASLRPRPPWPPPVLPLRWPRPKPPRPAPSPITIRPSTIGCARSLGSGSKPGTTSRGMARLIRRSMSRKKPSSSTQTSEIASPGVPARPVRPMRCT